MKNLSTKLFAAASLLAIALNATPVARATTIFAISAGTQPTNVGTVTLTQVSATKVNVFVDLLNGYGFLNTGGPHTPFAFNLSGSEAGVSANFITPAAGTYAFGVFSLSTADGSNTPFGSFGISINDTAGNGSGKAYYGDLSFDVIRGSGLTEASFVPNGGGYYFSADLTDGRNTGAQAWKDKSPGTSVPDGGATVALVGAALAGLGLMARHRKVV